MPYAQFSSFQIAKMLGVSRQAVNQWVDKDFIKSYRTPGGHRRVTLEDLVSFLRDRKIPLPLELEERVGAANASTRAPNPDVVIIDAVPGRAALLEQAILKRAPNARFRAFGDCVNGLVGIGAAIPQLLLLDPGVTGDDALAKILQRLKDNPATRSMKIVVMSPDAPKSTAKKDALLPVERVLPQGLSPEEIAREILDVLGAAVASLASEPSPAP